MKKLLIGCMLLLCVLSADAQSSQILVTPQWLKEHQGDKDLVILQVSFLKMDFDKEHIPGAQYLWPETLAPNSPSGGSYNAPDPSAAAQYLETVGVSNNSRVVLVYVRNEVSQTARMFLTLEQLGLKDRVSLLDGGLEAWKKEGNPVTAEVTVPKKGKFKPNITQILVDKEYVLKTLNSDKGIVVDARIQRFYDGEPTGNPRDGHITGAKNIPYTEMVDQANVFKPVDQLQAYFTPVATKDKELVTYCFIGQTASVVYLAGRILGYNMKLYDGSLQEWSRIDSLPMEKTQK
jgi:thiosulfate/3-mercaptopyruvate sulfurtransferase